MEHLIDYIVKGGWVMYPLLFCSVLALAVSLYKIFEFKKLKLHDTRCADIALELLSRELVRRSGDEGEYELVINNLKLTNSPLSAIMEATIGLCAKKNSEEKLSFQDIELEIDRIGGNIIDNLSRGLRTLVVIIAISPLLGLLGTVLGMIDIFQVIESSSNQINPSLMGGGIWKALLTTAFGLIIAIPYTAVYHYLDSEIEKVKLLMKNYVVKIIVAFKSCETLSRPSC